MVPMHDWSLFVYWVKYTANLALFDRVATEGALHHIETEAGGGLGGGGGGDKGGHVNQGW